MSNPPRPVVSVLLTCRRIVKDAETGEFLLLAPWSELTFPAFPHREPTGIYVEYTSGHGEYLPSFELRDMDDQVVWSLPPYQRPMPKRDPLMRIAGAFHSVPIDFPRPGKYELVWVLNGQEAARRSLSIRAAKPSQQKTRPVQDGPPET